MLISQQSIPNLGKLQSGIRGRKCEVHVSSVVEQQDLDDKMANLSVDPSKVSQKAPL